MCSPHIHNTGTAEPPEDQGTFFPGVLLRPRDTGRLQATGDIARTARPCELWFNLRRSNLGCNADCRHMPMRCCIKGIETVQRPRRHRRTIGQAVSLIVTMPHAISEHISETFPNRPHFRIRPHFWTPGWGTGHLQNSILIQIEF
jgi:hypothetical protein